MTIVLLFPSILIAFELKLRCCLGMQLDYLARTNAANDIEKAYQVAFTQLQQVVSSLG